MGKIYADFISFKYMPSNGMTRLYGHSIVNSVNFLMLGL